MMPTRYCLLFLLLFTQVFSLELRENPISLSTSVIVPCHSSHFDHLTELLIHYQNQTVIPDEVVVSLSGTDQVPIEILDSIESSEWPFALIILRSDKPQSAGVNRNLAAHASKGDIIICQDADDIPHPQRIEIIKNLFEKYKVDHLMHLYRYDENFVIYDMKNISEFGSYCKNYKKLNRQSYPANGAPAFMRYVLDDISWPDASKKEDSNFNQNVYKKYAHNVILNRFLYCYRYDLTISLDSREKKRKRQVDSFIRRMEQK